MVDPRSVLPKDRPLWTRWNTLWRPPPLEVINLVPSTRSRNAVMGYVIGAAVVLGRENSNEWWSYSRRRGWYYEHNRPRYWPTVSNLYEATISAVDSLATTGLIEHQKMPPGHRDWQSRFRATPELLRLFERGRLPLVCDPPNRIILRDRNGDLLQYNESRRIQDLRTQLDAFNEVALSMEIGLNGRRIREGDPLAVDQNRFGAVTLTMHRVFTVDFSKHGRWYGPWVQNIPKAVRATLTINGDAVREADYRELHCRILYAEAGEAMPHMPFEIDGWDRRTVKASFYILVNAMTTRAAIGAIADHLGGRSRAFRAQAESLIANIVRKHSAIADRFGTDAGLKLMAVDAALTRKNLTKLHRAGIAAIPIHDSNLVPAQYADKTTEVMEETLQKHLRISSCNLVALSVPVAKRHQGDGAELVLQNGPRVVVGWSLGALFLPALVVVGLPAGLASLVVVSSFYSGSVIGLERAA